MRNRRVILIAVLFMLSIGNYSRIIGNENIRTIQFLSIFAIGALSALLIREIALLLKSKRE
jgi:TM2 domain-containing membrane protein YozV